MYQRWNGTKMLIIVVSKIIGYHYCNNFVKTAAAQSAGVIQELLWHLNVFE